MYTKSNENNYAFIDSQNLNLAVQDQGWKLNWTKFRVYLQDKYAVTKAYLFIGYIPTNQDLYTSLQQKGYIIVFKPTLTLPGGKPKGNTDAELVLHTMLEYPNYEKAVIVSGDGDYYCLIEHLKKQGKLKKLIIPNRNEYSSLLRKFLPDMAFVSDLRGKLEYK
ncbi:MAG: NYN domain-containing protein [Candidatus Aminicenantes bacterium]|nr:NYN domain-containing protein [Candidatus Aminicenantes bacterium]MBL7151791.1 NYN domain-containing protein [Candidatus Omnitrophota bacterium]